MTTYGGYLEMELPKGGEPYHRGAAALNSARSALRHLLCVRKFRKVHVPFYCCGAVSDAVARAGVECAFYRLNEAWEPVLDPRSVRESEVLLYVNYFGLLQEVAERVAVRFGRVIIDNSQAFFAPPIPGTDSFYSARKFFGVSDGGYLYLNGEACVDLPYEQDVSWKRCEHLLRRIDCSPEDGYEGFRANEMVIDRAGVLRMSKLSERVMSSIDHGQVQSRRSANYRALTAYLRNVPGIEMPISSISSNVAPLALPVIIRFQGIRDALLRRQIFVPCYWREVLDRVVWPALEAQWTQLLMPLPVDQRYSEEDMRHMAAVVCDAMKEAANQGY